MAAAIGKSSSLESFTLRYNRITDEGARALATAIEKSASLRFMDLYENLVTDVGAAALAISVEKSRCVEQVSVWGRFVTRTGRRAVAMAKLHRPARRAVWVVCRNVDDHRCAPVARFLRLDGDHAILTRVLQFLLCAE